MGKKTAQNLEKVIREIRQAFHRLGAVADDLHAEAGVTAAMRGVMETLAEGGPQTVPAMARAKSVSRQHIQVLVNALIEAKLAAYQNNPAHKRSPFVVLTDDGNLEFAKIRHREARLLRQLSDSHSKKDLTVAQRTLEVLNVELSALPPFNRRNDDDDTNT